MKLFSHIASQIFETMKIRLSHISLIALSLSSTLWMSCSNGNHEVAATADSTAPMFLFKNFMKDSKIHGDWPGFPTAGCLLRNARAKFLFLKMTNSLAKNSLAFLLSSTMAKAVC
jgi:hypothetical protein